MANIPDYSHFTGSVLVAQVVPGAKRIRVGFNNGYALMSLVPAIGYNAPTPTGTQLPMPMRHSDALILSNSPQIPDVMINIPQDTVIHLQYDITDGIPHYR